MLLIKYLWSNSGKVTGFSCKSLKLLQDYHLSGDPCNPVRSGSQYNILMNPGIRMHG